VHTIRGADFQSQFAVGFFRHFVDGSRTEVLAGVAVFFYALRGADVGVGNAKMARLIFFVARARVVDVGEAIKRQFAIAFEALGRGTAIDFPVGFVARVRAHGINQAAAAGNLLKRSVKKTSQHAVLEGLMKIADLPELFFDVALLNFSRQRA
jgi:hypothetical protein